MKEIETSSPRIENARNFDSAIEIISEKTCTLGLFALQFEFKERFGKKLNDVVVIPILKGGKRVGEEIILGQNVDSAPMQMSYYDENNQRMDAPRCIVEPNINQIIVNGKVREVVFAEGVVDSEGTIKKSIEVINNLIDKYNSQNSSNYEYPVYHVFALVSKVNGNSTIPNFVYPFTVDPRIWVHGWGVDNSQKGRDLNCIKGILSPFADSTPSIPYYKETSLFEKHFKKMIYKLYS